MHCPQSVVLGFLALGVALHILIAGLRAVRHSVSGLLDEALSAEETATIEQQALQALERGDAAALETLATAMVGIGGLGHMAIQYARIAGGRVVVAHPADEGLRVAGHVELALAPAQQQVLRAAFDALLANNLAQPRVFVHRDYHSRNLMVARPNPGIIDFQDAVVGPVSYDVASLFRIELRGFARDHETDALTRRGQITRRQRHRQIGRAHV